MERKITIKKGKAPVPLFALDNKKEKFSKRYIEARKDMQIKGIADDLEMPDFLDENAEIEYRRIIGLYRLANIEFLNNMDIGLLAMRCETWAKWLMLNKEEKGLIKRASGNVSLACGTNEQFNKSWSANQLSKEKAQKFILRCDQELCLTPIARERLGVLAANNKEKETDEMAALLNGGGGEVM